MRNSRTDRGQALVLVTLSLVAMFGVIGLAIDFGSAFYVKKMARAAAESAALAAARHGLDRVGSTSAWSTLSTQTTLPGVSCSGGSVADEFANGCQYATANNFVNQNDIWGQRETYMAGGAPAAGCFPNCIPTAPGVHAYYWVSATSVASVPQLFSAIFGRMRGTVSARATAAILEGKTVGSLILLNRRNDPNPEMNMGIDLLTGGGGGQTGQINAPGGIILASSANGGTINGKSGIYAGDITNGSKDVIAPFTWVMDDGTYQGQVIANNVNNGTGSATWTVPPVNVSDPTSFRDPFEGKGQPPIKSGTFSGTQTYTVPCKNNACTISGGSSWATATQLPEGYYIGVGSDGVSHPGLPITLGSGYFQFTASSAFGDYFFFGGLETGSGTTSVSVAPGRYVLVGNSTGGPLLSLTNGSVFTDDTTINLTSVPPITESTSKGSIFIFTGTDNTNSFPYPGVAAHAAAAGISTAEIPNFEMAQTGIKMGNNSNSVVYLHGIDANTSLTLPSETNASGKTLKDFAPAVMWQDQANSAILYTSSGGISNTCGAGAYVGCPNTTLRNSLSPKMFMQAGSNVRLWGAAYQPRGSWLELGGGSNSVGPVQLVSGAINVTGGGSVILTGIDKTITRTTVALIE